MFKPITPQELKKLGISEPQQLHHIQGLDCWTPPVGWVYNYLDSRWEYTGVYQRSKDPAECYWEKDERWDKYKTWRAEEDKIQKTNPDFVHATLANFIRDCWIKRLGGMWFSNNGEPTYITGQHWLYLSCYTYDGGNVRYREVDRDSFYAWQYCWEDPNCYGLIEVTKRRNGKTGRSALIAIDLASRIPFFHAGIQSKTDRDAQDVVYKRAVVSPYRKFPYFFQPVSNLPKGGAVPASGLQFNSGKMGTDTEELESLIDFRASNVTAYDGTKLGYAIVDEPGKTTLCNVYDRWNVVKYCLVDDEKNIVGKAYFVTTVEDMDSGGREFFDLWKDSDQKQKEHGMTVSGLYRIFTPAQKTRNIDKYGKCDEEANRLKIIQERAVLASKPRELASAKRKEPLDEHEAFQTDAEECAFDFNKLLEREDELKWFDERELGTRGNFRWVNGKEFTEVEFVPNPNGNWLMIEDCPEERRNRVIEKAGYWHPDNCDLYCAGTDPYQHKFLKKNSIKTLSLGACVIRRFPHPNYPSPIEYGIAAFYLGRPLDPMEFFMDTLCGCWYYGCKNLAENNKERIVVEYENWGCGNFIPFLPGVVDKRGITATEPVVNTIFTLTDSFISKHLGSIKVLRLVRDWLRFNRENTQEFDAPMAFGYSEILFTSAYSSQNRRTPSAVKDISSILPHFKKKVRQLRGTIH